MGHDELAQGLGSVHGLLHLGRVLNPLAVVGKGHHLAGQPLQVRQGLPLLSHGDGPVGMDVDHRVPADEVQLGPQVRRAVRHRLEVGHGAHGGKASPGRRSGAGGNGLFVRKTRLTEMNMYIYETGK